MKRVMVAAIVIAVASMSAACRREVPSYEGYQPMKLGAAAAGAGAHAQATSK